MFPRDRLRVLAAAAACALVLPASARAAVSYHFQWVCTSCAGIGVGSFGKEGPYATSIECENARRAMAASLSLRGCGMGCFTPQLCQSEEVPEAPSALRRPDISVPAPASALPYGTGARRRAEQAEEEREQAEREAASRNGKEGRSAAPPDLAPNWRNAFSRYQVRRLQAGLEIVLAETCAVPDCSRKTNPDRPVFRGRQQGDRLVGTVIVRSAVESVQDGKRCTTPAGEFPIEGRISSDGERIVWQRAELPAQPGCLPANLSLGAWRRDR
jgi:hypothetical protein